MDKPQQLIHLVFIDRRANIMFNLRKHKFIDKDTISKLNKNHEIIDPRELNKLIMDLEKELDMIIKRERHNGERGAI